MKTIKKCPICNGVGTVHTRFYGVGNCSYRDLIEDRFRSICYFCKGKGVVGIEPIYEDLKKQLEQVKTERDDLETFYKNITSKPDCNTCIKQNNCKYCPGIGEISRFNCPLWKGNKHDT